MTDGESNEIPKEDDWELDLSQPIPSDDEDFEPLLKKPKKKTETTTAKKRVMKKAVKAKKEPNAKAEPKFKQELEEQALENGVQQDEKVKDSKAKKFEKPGQRRETPPRSDPLRMFYESMYIEKKMKGVRSELAENWLVNHGILEADVAAEIVEERKQKKNGVLPLSQEAKSKTGRAR